MENAIILFRQSLSEEDEFSICKKYFDNVYELRSECRRANLCRSSSSGLVIGRYSCLPYYRELEQDLESCGCRLINSYAQHKWIADFEYYDVLKEYTPQTWFDHDFHTCKYDGPFVVKGKTNSRKHNWNTMMFALDKSNALDVAARLSSDAFIGEQGIIYRKYVPLETYETGINGIRFTNEWRLFFLGDKILSYGYYWTIAEKTDWKIDNEGIDFACGIASIVSKHVNFFVVDIAKTIDGRWIMIELNDGQMSGPSCNDLHILYSRLASWCRIREFDTDD